MADCSTMLTATQEACHAELEMAEASCVSSKLATVSDEQLGRPLQEADWQEVVYRVSNQRPSVAYGWPTKHANQ